MNRHPDPPFCPRCGWPTETIRECGSTRSRCIVLGCNWSTLTRAPVQPEDWTLRPEPAPNG